MLYAQIKRAVSVTWVQQLVRNESPAASLYLACTHHAGVAQDMHAHVYLTPVIHSWYLPCLTRDQICLVIPCLFVHAFLCMVFLSFAGVNILSTWPSVTDRGLSMVCMNASCPAL